MTVIQAESLLQTSYHVYSDGEHEVARTEPYNPPESLSQHIDFVAPTTTFPGARRKTRDHKPMRVRHRRRTSQPTCGSSNNTTPSCIREAYNITYNGAPNCMKFAAYAMVETIGSGDPAEGVPGVGGASETHLDAQTSLGLAWPAHSILYNSGGVFGPPSSAGTTYDPLVQFLQDLIHNETVPSVVSFSEAMPVDRIDPANARALCDMMMLVGMRGVTLLFSSGENSPQDDQPTAKHEKVLAQAARRRV